MLVLLFLTNSKLHVKEHMHQYKILNRTKDHRNKLDNSDI